jgi:hypothetical protein
VDSFGPAIDLGYLADLPIGSSLVRAADHGTVQYSAATLMTIRHCPWQSFFQVESLLFAARLRPAYLDRPEQM